MLERNDTHFKTLWCSSRSVWFQYWYFGGNERETRREEEKEVQVCEGSTPGELNTGAVWVLHTTVSASKVL